MEETIFEIMERTYFVDRLLLALAFAIPVLVLGAMRLFRSERFVSQHRPKLIATGLAAPMIWMLWYIYNKVGNHYGIDSIMGIFVNAIIIFLAVCGLTAFYYLVLVRYGGPAATGNESMEQPENLRRDDA